MVIGNFITSRIRKRSKVVVGRILPFIKDLQTIIDIGSGSGDVSLLLREQGNNVTPVDVADFHGPRLIETAVYDGKTLPFSSDTFDVALLLMVMHHTPSPEAVFMEAARVAKEIVVIETSYTNGINKLLTVLIDTLGNLRFNAHSASYKTDEGWREFFNRLGFMVIKSEKYEDRNLGLPFLHISYYLQRI